MEKCSVCKCCRRFLTQSLRKTNLEKTAFKDMDYKIPYDLKTLQVNRVNILTNVNSFYHETAPVDYLTS